MELKMNGLFIIMNFVGALALFLYAMTLMSESLQKIAGDRMRNILAKITNNPFSGVLTGVGVTTAIQSSSATTVMVVSFVNAGLISLASAVAVIMGANIGTTVTAWIITIFGLGASGSAFSLPMLCGVVAIIFLFSKRDHLKRVGELFIGLALLLVGMDLMKGAMPNLEEYPQVLEWMASLSGKGLGSTLLLVLAGALLTCVVQSSSATIAITLVMCYNGLIDFDAAIALVMGDNIGTTVTANIAAMVATPAGKKAARAHLIFNVVGVVITLIFLRPISAFVDWATIALVHSSPYTPRGAEGYSPTVIPLAITIFHTLFNVSNTLVQVWFIPQIIKIVNWMVREPEGEVAYDDYRPSHIAAGHTSIAEIDIRAAQKEIEDFGQRVTRMFELLPGLRTARDDKEFENTMHQIERQEEITDRMEQEIARYLTSLGAAGLSAKGSQCVSAMLRLVDNLESIGDDVLQIALLRRNKRQEAVHFSAEQNEHIDHMRELVSAALATMNAHLGDDYDKADLAAAYRAEDAINAYRDQLRRRHIDDLRDGRYDYAVGIAYSGIYALYEKMGDHIINISEAICGEKRLS